MRLTVLVVTVLAAGGCPGPATPPQVCTLACPTGMVCAPLAGKGLTVCVYTVGGVPCAPDQVVVGGACVAGQRRGRVCQDAAQCGPGYECRRVSPADPDAVCWPLQTDISGTIDGTLHVCRADEQPLGDLPARCLAVCGASVCGPAEDCLGNRCRPIDPFGQPCDVDGDCDTSSDRVDPPLPPYYCAEKTCLPRMIACASDVDCPSDFVCGPARACIQRAAGTLRYCPDADDDGYCADAGCVDAAAPGPATPPTWRPACALTEPASCDHDARANPGQREIPGDGIDNDCRGGDQAMMPPPTVTYYQDPDGDGYCGISQAFTSDPGPPWTARCATEPRACEGIANVHAITAEVCGDGIDNDCRGGDRACKPPPPRECPAAAPVRCECDSGFVSTCITRSACINHNAACRTVGGREGCACVQR